MKFLLCGCFHGKVPSKLIRVAKKENPDLIICTGDFSEGKYLREWEFKHWKEIQGMILKGKEIIKFYESMPGYKMYLKGDLKTANKVLNRLRSIKNKFYYTYGNHDGYSLKLLKKYSKLNFRFISRGKIKFNDYILIFYGGYRGTSGKPHLIDWKKASKKHKVLVKKRISQINKELNKLFNKKDKNVIFITHDPPYRTKLDLLSKKYNKYEKTKTLKERHIGDDIYRKFDEKFQPLIHVCGHMHENQGYDKIGKSLVINSGALLENKFALLELKKDKIRRLKFYK